MVTVQASTFGAVLRRCRRERGLTQEALAERAGVSVRALSDLERGAKHRPRRDTVALLAEALALSAEERATFEAAAHGPGLPAAGQLSPGPAAPALPLPPTPLVGR